MKKILINSNPEGKIGIQIVEVARILDEIKSIKQNEEVQFDLNGITFLHTTFILGWASIIKSNNINYKLINCSKSLSTYLDTIKFPLGLTPETNQNWDEYLNTFSDKTYLPIINFSNSVSEEVSKNRNNIISHFTIILSKYFTLDINIYSAISYFISEFTDNIVEHSKVDTGWLFYQYFPENEYVEFSIIDTGISYLGAYQKDNSGEYTDITTDILALEKATQGYSTKGKERGRGLRTSTQLILNGLKGKLFINSGSAMFIAKDNGDNKILPSKFWKGTILTIQLPKPKNCNLNLYDYVK